MSNVILYCRVSTSEQADGCSLDYQQSALVSYCERNNHHIIEIYREDCSAKGYELDRPELTKIYSYCRKNKSTVDKILFLRWDRFTRNVGFAFEYKRLFYDELKIEINSIESPIDFDDPNWPVFYSFHCGMAHTEDLKISIRTKEGIHASLLKGRWANKAPRGHKNVRTGKNETHVEIDAEKSEHIKSIFKEVAKGIEAPCSIRRKICPDIPESSFLEMLRNVFYIGKIRVPEYKEDEEVIVDGIHEPLIDEETFNEVQRILDGKSKKPLITKKINPDLYLRKYLICPVCGKRLTGSTSKGNGGKYTYYHCSCSNHFRVRAEDTNRKFEEFVGTLEPKESIVNLYREIFNDLRGDISNKRKEKKIKIENTIAETGKKLQKLEDEYYGDGTVSQEDYSRISKRFKEEIRKLEEDIKGLEPIDKEEATKIDYALELMGNLGKLMKGAPADIKCELIGSIFFGNIQFDGNFFRTCDYNKVLEFILQDTSKLRGEENKKSEFSNENSDSVPRAGVEPARVAPLVFETSASTDSAIWALAKRHGDELRVQR